MLLWNMFAVKNPNEFYSNYWNERNVSLIDGMRAPMTHFSEHTLLPLIKNEETEKWYKHCKYGIILNWHGYETCRFSGSDYDGDIVLTTNNKTMIESVIHGEYPVVYEAPKPQKIIPTEKDLYIFDKFAMGSIIGQITNKGASAYALLPILEKKYGKDSVEYQMTLCRLKQSCKAQSAQIDKSKLGREVKGIPNDWMVAPTEDKLESRELTYSEYKHILLNRRPYFFKYLYRDSKKDYKKYQDKQETLCIKMFGKPLDTVLNSLNPTKEEQKFVEDYYEWSPLIESDSCMNVLCRYIESVDFEIKDKIKTKDYFDAYHLYKNLGVSYSLKQEQLALKALQE